MRAVFTFLKLAWERLPLLFGRSRNRYPVEARYRAPEWREAVLGVRRRWECVVSIDLEDWYSYAITADEEDWRRRPARLDSTLPRILDLLDEHGTQATFFVLGRTARRHPSLIQEVHRRGHELALHGDSHRFVWELGPEGFTRDLVRAKETVAELTGVQPRGYRASTFSVDRRTIWAFDILAEHGMRYDSSIAPLHFLLYGEKSAPRSPHRLENGLWEFPLSTVSSWKGLQVVAGGFYLRKDGPDKVTALADRALEQCGYVNAFVHPWEFDPSPPRWPDMNPLLHRARYFRNKRTPEHLSLLLQRYRCTNFETYLRSLEAASGGSSAPEGGPSSPPRGEVPAADPR